MQERDTLKEECTELGDASLLKEFKVLRNRVRHNLVKDRDKFYKSQFFSQFMTVKDSWKIIEQLNCQCSC